MFCGKIAAGKSTLAARLAQQTGGVLISEDDWLAALFGDQMSSPRDYLRCADKLRAALAPHVAQLLRAGVSVVLDCPANTVHSRVWLRALLRETGADHQMHVLAPPDALCLARLAARNAAQTHPFAVTEAQFHQFAQHFAPPEEDEGFNTIQH